MISGSELYTVINVPGSLTRAQEVHSMDNVNNTEILISLERQNAHLVTISWLRTAGLTNGAERTAHGQVPGGPRGFYITWSFPRLKRIKIRNT